MAMMIKKKKTPKNPDADDDRTSKSRFRGNEVCRTSRKGCSLQVEINLGASREWLRRKAVEI